MKKRIKITAFTLIELLVVISIIAILASIAVPVFGKAIESAARSKALSNGKQIGYGLRLFAQDHNGIYPNATDPNDPTSQPPNDSNTLFANNIVPDYVSDETIFTISKSKWSAGNNGIGADGKIGNGQTLLTGENAWAYLTQMTDTSTSTWPLLVSSPMAGATTFSTDEGVAGGVWHGAYAVVVHVDISASADRTYQASGAKTTTLKRPDKPSSDALVPDSGVTPAWLPSTTLVLHPL